MDFEKIIPEHYSPVCDRASAFAPANVALCKYWGKRDTTLNLPVTSSLSLSLGERGTRTAVSVIDQPSDRIILNGVEENPTSMFARRLMNYLNNFRTDKDFHFLVETENTIPTAAGVASSASGFAALVLALNDLFCWELDQKSLSILARLGSGSASRSLWQGFVKWHCGERDDGMDSFAEPLPCEWPELRVGLWLLSTQAKSMSSRDAMLHCMETSLFYRIWPYKVADDLRDIHRAIDAQDFKLLGETSESNSEVMHVIMLTAHPMINYSPPETMEAKDLVRQLREEGIPVYFTQDAGPNLKLLFLEKDEEKIKQRIPLLDVINPWKK